MQLLLELNKRDLKLSMAEALALLTPSARTLRDNYLFVESSKKSYSRLAYTRSVYRVLFSCAQDQLKGKLSAYSWQKIYRKSFSVRVVPQQSTFSDKELGGVIFDRLNKPVVELKNPTTPIVILFLDNVYVTLLLHQQQESFVKRKAHTLPFPHPSSLHPQLARAMINLTGAKAGSTILDPFCGAGSILIEAGLMKLKPVGSDIDPMMLKRAKANLAHFKIANVKLSLQDALTIKKSYPCIVTDLPYARNTTISLKPEDLYGSFLKKLKEICTGSAVIGFPDFVDYKKLIVQAGLSITEEFTYYLHGSLSKKIVVIQV